LRHADRCSNGSEAQKYSYEFNIHIKHNEVVTVKGYSLRKLLESATFQEMRNQEFKALLITEQLCELCGKPMDRKEKVLRMIRISDQDDYKNLLTRAKAYDRAEIDIETSEVYFYDKDYPGDVHPSCVEKL